MSKNWQGVRLKTFGWRKQKLKAKERESRKKEVEENARLSQKVVEEKKPKAE